MRLVRINREFDLEQLWKDVQTGQPWGMPRLSEFGEKADIQLGVGPDASQNVPSWWWENPRAERQKVGRWPPPPQLLLESQMVLESKPAESRAEVLHL